MCTFSELDSGKRVLHILQAYGVAKLCLIRRCTISEKLLENDFVQSGQACDIAEQAASWWWGRVWVVELTKAGEACEAGERCCFGR